MPDLPVPALDANARAWVFTLKRLMDERMIGIAGKKTASSKTAPPGARKHNARYFAIQPRT